MTFSGLPINGRIVYGADKKEQKTEEEFLAILQPVLDDPTISAVCWKQYTPYFNDGDPCVFRAYLYGASIRGSYDYEEDDEIDEFPPYSDEGRAAFGRRGYGTDTQYEGPDEARYDRLTALANAVGDGSFDDVLLTKFGDHAVVKVVPKDGIYIEFYEHD